MQIFFLTLATVVFFAANAILCRLSLVDTGVNAETFTIIRTVSAALTLWLFMTLKGQHPLKAGRWRAGFALFVYLAGFSWGFVALPTAVGVLVLTVAIQVTMLCLALWHKESVSIFKILGITIGVIGIAILFPNLNLHTIVHFSANSTMEGPSPLHVVYMLCAGVGWGFYSMYGKGIKRPDLNTAGNFIRCLPFTALLLFLAEPAPWEGVFYAILSGSIASGFGYIIWYALVEKTSISTAAVIQLGVPPLAMLGGMLLLGETITLRYIISTIITLGGIALAVSYRPKTKTNT